MEPESDPKTAQVPIRKVSFGKIVLPVLLVTLLAGVFTGFKLSSSNPQSAQADLPDSKPAKAPQQDRRTFRDFAEGKIAKKQESSPGYSEGTHLLIRENAVPVALTSSVIDLSLYEDKKVKVYGETQKAIKEGWLMDVGRVEDD